MAEEPSTLTTWPPAPDAAKTESTDPLTTCPHCKRKLLSTRSILCNWCGERIDDPEYLEKAAQERALLDLQVKEQLDKELSETARMGILGRLNRKKNPNLGAREHILIPPPDAKKADN